MASSAAIVRTTRSLRTVVCSTKRPLQKIGLCPQGSVQTQQLSSVQDITHQRIAGRRRFYKSVSVQEDPAVPGHWHVHLDRSALRTPARRPMVFDSKELAMAVASEWDAQTSTKGIEPATMPLMTLVSTAIDQVSEAPEVVIDNCLKYIVTDTVCFYSSKDDQAIVRRQQDLWGPLKDWLAQDHGVKLEVSDNVLRRPTHPPESVARVRTILEGMDPWTLAVLQCVTMECKSLVIGLAVVFRRLGVKEAFNAARLEEEFQMEQWGLVEGGHDMDRSNTMVQLSAASTLMWLKRIGSGVGSPGVPSGTSSVSS